MSIGPTAGSKLYIGTTETITSPDDWIEIGDIATLGDFGRVYNEIKVESVGNRNVTKFKGTRDDGNMTISLHRNALDVGQAAAIVALDVDLDYNFKLTLNDATVALTTATYFTWTGKVMSFQTKLGGPNNVVMADLMIGINSNTIVVVDVH